MAKGWKNESRRHSLAARGVKTAVNNPKEKAIMRSSIPRKEWATGKRIMEIDKVKWNQVSVEYFDMDSNSKNFNEYGTATRRVYFPSEYSGRGAYIKWGGEKKIVESLFT